MVSSFNAQVRPPNMCILPLCARFCVRIRLNLLTKNVKERNWTERYWTNTQVDCDRRRYDYILPLHVLDPASNIPARNSEGVGRDTATAEGGAAGAGEGAGAAPTAERSMTWMRTANGATGAAAAAGTPAFGAPTVGAAPGAVPGAAAGSAAAAAAPAAPFQFDARARAALNDLLGQYVGTHNFHNFTPKVRSYGGPGGLE